MDLRGAEVERFQQTRNTFVSVASCKFFPQKSHQRLESGDVLRA